MKLVSIADFRVNEYGLWESYKDGEALFIEKVLEKEDMETYVYYEKDLGSTIDIAEDLTSFSDELVVLITDDVNYKLNLALACKIMDEEEDCKVILKVREGIINFEYMKSARDRCVVVDNFEDLAKEMKEDGFGDLSDIELYHDVAEISDTSNCIEILLGCKSDKVNSRSLALLKNDISKLCNNNKKLKIKFIGIFIENFVYAQEFVDYLTQYKDKEFIFHTNYKNIPKFSVENIHYNIHLSYECVTNDKLDLSFVKDRINMITLDKNIFNDVKIGRKIINYILEYTENIRFEGDSYIEQDKLNNCVPKKYMELMNGKYQALSTGILYSKTGEYVSIPLNGFVKHLYVDKSNVDEGVINFINEVCSINSSVLIGGIRNHFNMNEFNVNTLDEVCQKNSEVYSIEEQAEAECSFPFHIAYADEDKLNIDGIKNDADLEFIEMPLSEYKLIKGKDYKKMYVFTVDTEKDLDCLINQVDEYYNTKRIYKSYLLNGRLKNMCRFMNRNYCFVTKLPRLAINDKREVCPCYEMNEKIGDLTSSVYELTQEVYYKHQMRLKDNKCATCSVSVVCSKCIYMPEFLKSKYCNIMRNKTYITDFLIESMVLSNSSRINTRMKKLNYEDIVISNEYLQNILSENLIGEGLPYFFKYTFIIMTKDFYAIWSPNINKIFNITKEMVVVCEALFKRLSYKKIILEAAKYNHMTEQDSKLFCDKVIDILFTNNMLQRSVMKE